MAAGSYPGINSPALRVANATMEVRNMGSIVGNNQMFDLNYGHVFLLGVSPCAYGCNPLEPLFSTSDAWSIDRKLDDGKPSYGKITTIKKGASDPWNANTANCATTAVSSTAEYDVGVGGPMCRLTMTFLN